MNSAISISSVRNLSRLIFSRVYHSGTREMAHLEDLPLPESHLSASDAFLLSGSIVRSYSVDCFVLMLHASKHGRTRAAPTGRSATRRFRNLSDSISPHHTSRPPAASESNILLFRADAAVTQYSLATINRWWG
jgi:hypothetical protein